MRRLLLIAIAFPILAASYALGADLLPDTNPVALFANAGSTVPVTVPVNVAASSGALNFTATVSTSSGGHWLSVSPTSGTTPATLTVSADPTGLVAGNYTGFITLACTAGSSCASVMIEVDFSVEGIVLTAAPNMVTATVVQGLKQNVNIVLTGAASVSAATNQSWLVAPATVDSPGSLTLTIDATTLPAGKYLGAAVLQCVNGSPCLPVTVTVTLTVTAPVSISANPSAVAFAAFTGRGNPAPKTVVISASDGSSVPFTVTGAPSWLGVSNTSGSTGQGSGTLTLTPVTSGLTAGGASTTLTITPGNSAPALALNIVLSFVPFSITASPNSLSVSVESGNTQTATFAVSTVDSAPATVNIGVTGSSAVTVPGSTITAPASVTATVNAAGVPAGTYAATIGLTCAAANPCAAVNVGVQIMVSAGHPLPTISTNGVVPIYNTTPVIAPGEWASLYGSNLVSGQNASWNGPFPVPLSLGGTSVTIDGNDAPLIYAGPGQINFQVPDDTATGTVPVSVTTANGNATATVTLAPYAPSFLLLDGKHVAAEIYRGDGSGTHGSYDILGPTGTSLGYQTVAAKPGDIVELYAVGFGPTNPSVPTGQPPPGGGAPALALPVITIGGANAPVSYAGVVAVGLYQINVTVPPGAGSGDQVLLGAAGGAQTQSNVLFAMQ